MRYEYDAIVVGTGIGGAAVGALLAYAGWKVLILDKNKIVGGRCTSYEYKGFTVDLGNHLFSMGDKGPLGDICRQVKMPDAVDWVVIEKASMQVGEEIKKYSRKTMLEVLPDNEAENLNNLFACAMQLSSQDLGDLWYVPLEKWVNNFTRDPLAHTLIESIESQYFCVPSSEVSTAEFIQCFSDVVKSQSSAYPRGGCIAIPKAYVSAMEKYGGNMRLNTKVKKVIVQNGEAVGVTLEDGTECRAPVIIINGDIKTAVRDLVGVDHFPEDYVQKIQSLSYSYHSVMVKVALVQKITDDQLRMYMPNEFSPILKVTEEMRQGEIPELVGAMVTCPTNFDTSLCPPGRQLICFATACPPSQDWKKWGKVLLKSFFNAYPQAKDKILWYRFDTPELVNAYAGETGNIVGVGQTINQIHERRPSVKSPLKGLFFSSAEAGGHGIGTELAAKSAMELFEILKSR